MLGIKSLAKNSKFLIYVGHFAQNSYSNAKICEIISNTSGKIYTQMKIRLNYMTHLLNQTMNKSLWLFSATLEL